MNSTQNPGPSPDSSMSNTSENSAPLASDSVIMVADGIAHDINNLMTTILGNAALIRSEIGTRHSVTVLLDRIEDAAETAAASTQRLLSFTRDRTHGAEYVNLNTIVYHALLTEEQKLSPRIRIHRYIAPDLPKLATSDHTGIAELTLALAQNAIEGISGEGRVVLRTRAVTIDDTSDPETAGLRPGHYVQFVVEDNGSGMSPDVLGQVFEPGFTTKDGHEGAGLTRARQVVSANGGHIVITSSVGHGTLCQVYLPAIDAEEVAMPSAPSDMPRGTETILLIDDERIILEVTHETLKRLGYQTLLAHNGKEAVDIAQTYRGPIHLALMDMAMPVMGGAEAYPLLRQARSDMKIIVCTGFDQDLASHALIEAGASSFLLKPFRPTVLAQEIRRVLDAEPEVK